MKLKKWMACFVSGIVFLTSEGVLFSKNVYAEGQTSVLPYNLTLAESDNTTQSLGGTVRFTLQNLNMQKDDVLHFHVCGDAGDAIQLYFYYTDSNGIMSSYIIGGLGGTILDNSGEKTIDFTAPNDLNCVTGKIVYNQSEPSYTYTVEYQSVITTTATTAITTTETAVVTTDISSSVSTTTSAMESAPDDNAAFYHYAEKNSIAFDAEQDTYNSNSAYSLFGYLDYLQEVTDCSGQIYAVIGGDDSVSLVPKDSEKESVVFSKPGYTFGAATIDDQDNLYLLWGKALDNSETDEDNIQICQYSLSGNLQSTYILSSEITSSAIPYDAGNANLAYYNGKLAVLFDTEWKSMHQGSEIFLFDVDTKEVELSRTNTCSHSFGVSMIPTDNGFVSIQRGDCYDRGIILHEIDVNQNYLLKRMGYHISGVYGESGQHQNDTYTLMGGIASSAETYAIAGKSERFYASDSYADYHTGVYDVFVRIIARNTEDTLPLAGVDRIDELTGETADENVIWLTECDDVMQAGSVKVVPLNDNRYCILWETLMNGIFDHISYVIIDQYGNQLQNETCIYNARLSDTSIQPIVQDEVLTWAIANKKDGTIDWYTVDLNQKILVPSRIIGDVNQDGAITAADAVLLQKYLLHDSSLTQKQWVIADLTEDGSVNGIDLAALKGML